MGGYLWVHEVELGAIRIVRLAKELVVRQVPYMESSESWTREKN